jgi:DNA-binding NtrC family response regulator
VRRIAAGGPTNATPIPPPPRVLVVSGEQGHRALLRAQLRQAGYDAVGASTLSQALRQASVERGRGPVRLVVVDSMAAFAEPIALERVRARHRDAQFVLILGAGGAPLGPWAATLPRPLTIGDIATTVERLLPLPPAQRRPLD